MENKEERCFLYDVYDGNGSLLVRRGDVVTDTIERMLKRRSISYRTTEKETEKKPERVGEPEYFLEDIFDRNGRLLVPKGTEITENIKNLMRIRHIHFRAGNKSQLAANSVQPDYREAGCYANERLAKVLKPIVAVRRKNIADIRANISNVAIRMPQIDYLSLMGASEAVSNILCEGKNEMWGLHINSLANCVDWIYSHVINVSIISTMLAKKIGLSSDRVYYTSVAAILHDIGMVMVPDDILNFAGKLSDEDEKLIQGHPLLGYKMLLNTKLPEEVLLGVLHHHEKSNGQGYPAKLQGKEISSIARLIHIVDTFDSMTSDRPYRKSLPLQETLAEMKLSKSNGFDPIILDGFLKLFRLES